MFVEEKIENAVKCGGGVFEVTSMDGIDTNTLST